MGGGAGVRVVQGCGVLLTAEYGVELGGEGIAAEDQRDLVDEGFGVAGVGAGGAELG